MEHGARRSVRTWMLGAGTATSLVLSGAPVADGAGVIDPPAMAEPAPAPPGDPPDGALVPLQDDQDVGGDFLGDVPDLPGDLPDIAPRRPRGEVRDLHARPWPACPRPPRIQP